MYATQIEAERTFVFGSSGLLFRSNKLMYDRQTASLWHSLTGEPVVGTLAYSGIRLKRLPVVVTTWRQWREDHPGTKALSLRTGYTREYYPGAAYGAYFASPETMFPVWRRSALLPAKSLVFALELNGAPKAYPLDALGRERVVNDTLGGVAVVLVADGQGRTVRAYGRAGRVFRQGAVDGTLQDERGRAWSVSEDALVSSESVERLERLAGHIAYWFGWFAFNPRTLIYGH